MNRLFLFLLLFLFFDVLPPSTCCLAVGPQATTLLDNAEGLLEERPDSALAILNRIDASRIHTSRARARFYLLKGIALDKNYIDDGSFLSEMEFAADWYTRHDRGIPRACACYYLADQLKDAGEVAEAAIYFSQSQEIADICGDWFLSGMASRNLADIYLGGYDYAKSLDCSRNSVAAFEKTNKPAHVLYAKMQLAASYYNNGYLDECIDLCDSLREEATAADNTGVLADALETAALAYIKLTPPQYDSTLCLLDLSARLFPLSAQNQALYAWALCLRGDLPGARKRIDQAYHNALSRKDSLYVLPWAANVARVAGDFERYTSLQERLVAETDTFARNTVIHTVDCAQAQYHRHQAQLLSLRMKQNKMCLMGGLVFTTLLIIFLTALARIRKKRLAEKSQANQALSAKLALYGTTVEETLDFGFGVLNQLSEAYYHPNTAQPEAFREILREYVSDVASRSQLGEAIEQNINIIHDDVITRLRAEIPSLKEKDIKLYSLYLFGFSYKAISEFFPEFSSVNSTYSRVSRLRKAIAESGSAHAAFFLSFLEKRPTNGRADVAKTRTFQDRKEPSPAIH